MSSTTPRIGVSDSRLRKPVWMSRAKSVPVFIVANSAPWMNGTARMNATIEPVGNPGMCVSARSPAELTASSISGKTTGAMMFAGWRNVRTTERRASRYAWSAVAVTRAPSRARRQAPLLRRRRPRASGRSWRGRRRRATPGAAGAARPRRARRRVRGRSRRGRPGPSGSLTAIPRTDATGSPKRARIAVARSLSAGSAGTTSTVGRPISAFSAAGVPSATIRPWSMIPTRSARTSASSRYCVVRKTVTPSSFASRRTSSQSAVRLWMSNPVVGSSRKRMCGRWTSASARSSRRFIPPE